MRLFCRLGLAWVLLGAAVLPAQTAAPTISAPLRVDEVTTACQGLRIVALGPERIAVGWAVNEGAQQGVFFRQRQNLLWETVQCVAGSRGEQPRDLDLAFDTRGRLNMVWTARYAGRRCLQFARLGDPHELTPKAVTLEFPQADVVAGDADFPTLEADPQGGLVLVWQESQAMRFIIRAARLPEDGPPEDLGNVSGSSLSGMTPQILSTRPLCVAWHEISELGSELRVDQWQPQEKRWRPSAAERQTRRFPAVGQALLSSLPEGLVACWQAIQADGHSAIKLGFAPSQAVEQTLPSPTIQTLAEPPGDHSFPRLSGSLPGRLTLSWQVFTQGQQMVRLAALPTGGAALPQAVTISAPAQRFASLPDHVTVKGWSAVAWTDDVRDGGRGGVYFAEVAWPQLP